MGEMALDDVGDDNVSYSGCATYTHHTLQQNKSRPNPPENPKKRCLIFEARSCGLFFFFLWS